MYILPRIKKFSACSLAILLTFGSFGFTRNESLITTHADKEQSQYSQKLDDLSKKQQELEKKIANADDNIKGQQEKLENVSKQMKVISDKIKSSEKYASQIEDEMCKIDDKMRETEYNLSNKEDEIKGNVNDFMKRVRAMYVNGSNSYTSIIASSDDFYDILMRTELIKKVAEHDNDTIKALIKQKKDIDKTKNDLEKQSESLKKKSKEYSEQQKNLSAEYDKLVEMKSEYGESLSTLESDKNSYQDEVDQVLNDYKDVAEQAARSTSTTKVTTTKSTTKKATKSTKKTTTTKRNTTTKTTKKSTTTHTTTKTNIQTTKKQTTPKPTTTPKKTTVNTPQTKPPISSGNEPNSSKANILVNTARSMVGAAYVWGSATPYATDCSGLTMQCYAKIGISLPHKASAQANYGTAVSYSNMQKGDLIFFGGNSYSSIYHVAIYVGDGKMIHAENTNTGVVISYVSSFSKYNHITCIKRLI